MKRFSIISEMIEYDIFFMGVATMYIGSVSLSVCVLNKIKVNKDLKQLLSLFILLESSIFLSKLPLSVNAVLLIDIIVLGKHNFTLITLF